jgi:hypothetical protein
MPSILSRIAVEKQSINIPMYESQLVQQDFFICPMVSLIKLLLGNECSFSRMSAGKMSRGNPLPLRVSWRETDDLFSL